MVSVILEAGKIALNIISQQNLEGEVTEEVDTDEVKEQPVNVSLVDS